MKTAARLHTAILPLLLLAGCRHETPVAHAAAAVTGLQVATVRATQVPAVSPIVGTVRARESVSLSAQVTGRVTSVLVHEGDSVRAGQVLVRLDNAEARATAAQAESAVQAAEHHVDAAQAQATLAASTLERYQMLREQKSVSPQEFDEVARRSEAAAAELKTAQAQLAAQKAQGSAADTVAGYSTIVAPFAGVVTARHVDPGALAAPGTPLVDVDGGGPMQLVVSADESLFDKIRPGASLEVEIPAASPEPMAGRVAQIVPAADAASRSFQVKIDLPAWRNLMAGMYGTASIASSTRTAILAPQSAVVTHGSVHTVWALDAEHAASLRYVSLGSPTGSEVEILSGLSAGEQVVLAPGDRELGGSQIEARP